MSKRSLLAVLAVVVVVVVAFAVGRRSASPGQPRGAAGSAAVAARPAATTAGAEADADPAAAGSGKALRSEVRRLGSDERRRLGEQIAEARERARTSAATAPGEPPPADDSVPLDQVGKPLNDALHDAISMLATCFEQQLGSDAVRDAVEMLTAMMTMTSDPDLGTVIDTAQVTDASGRPLTAKLDECLRDTIDSLALPPAGKGGKIRVQYSFRF